jgi:hypothetical protein
MPTLKVPLQIILLGQFDPLTVSCGKTFIPMIEEALSGNGLIVMKHKMFHYDQWKMLRTYLLKSEVITIRYDKTSWVGLRVEGLEYMVQMSQARADTVVASLYRIIYDPDTVPKELRYKTVPAFCVYKLLEEMRTYEDSVIKQYLKNQKP